jgi:hypothetical protein
MMTGPEAMALLNRRGVRHAPIGNGKTCIGLWGDVDGPDVRAALKIIARRQRYP